MLSPLYDQSIVRSVDLESNPIPTLPLVVGSEISDPWANLGKSISLQILIEGLWVRCFQQNSTSGSLGKSYYNGKTGFEDICKGVPFDS